MTVATQSALNYIGGAWVESTSREHVRDVNPARSSESLGDATVSRPEDVVRAIDAAAAAYPEWRRAPAPQRGDMVRKAADLMELRRVELARLLTQEEGKTLPESLAEVVWLDGGKQFTWVSERDGVSRRVKGRASTARRSRRHNGTRSSTRFATRSGWSPA